MYFWSIWDFGLYKWGEMAFFIKKTLYLLLELEAIAYEEICFGGHIVTACGGGICTEAREKCHGH